MIDLSVVFGSSYRQTACRIIAQAVCLRCNAISRFPHIITPFAHIQRSERTFFIRFKDLRIPRIFNYGNYKIGNTQTYAGERWLI